MSHLVHVMGKSFAIRLPDTVLMVRFPADHISVTPGSTKITTICRCYRIEAVDPGRCTTLRRGAAAPYQEPMGVMKAAAARPVAVAGQADVHPAHVWLSAMDQCAEGNARSIQCNAAQFQLLGRDLPSFSARGGCSGQTPFRRPDVLPGLILHLVGAAWCSRGPGMATTSARRR
jgi:hypothetical protein